MSQIIMSNIVKSYAQSRVLDGVTLTLPHGITCLMGPSGVGKTTLAHILAGLLQPDSGELTGTAGITTSMVFQDDRLLSWESTLTNVLFVTTKKSTPRAIALLTQAGLGDDLYKKAAELSGGMKRRTALCRALIAEHDLLILDEPFKGLDEETKGTVMEMVRNHAAKNPRKFILCITHDEAEAKRLGGHIVTLAN